MNHYIYINLVIQTSFKCFRNMITILLAIDLTRMFFGNIFQRSDYVHLKLAIKKNFLPRRTRFLKATNRKIMRG